MHLFLKPIMEELVHLEETGKKLYLIMTYESMGLWLHTGILFDTPYRPKICKARLLLVTLDLPAKAIVMNTKYYNGEKSCQFCLQSGTTLPDNPLHQFWPHEKNVVLRDNASLQQHSKETLETGTTVCETTYNSLFDNSQYLPKHLPNI